MVFELDVGDQRREPRSCSVKSYQNRRMAGASILDSSLILQISSRDSSCAMIL
jgi:hypothetical protein